MTDDSSRRAQSLKHIFSLVAVIGAAISILGALLDFIPGTSPGLSLPQLMMILGGAVLALVAYVLRGQRKRHLAVSALKNHLLACAAIIVATLFVLEIVLLFGGLPTYFPQDIPEKFLDPVPWWTCDASGCHYVYEEMVAACERGDLADFRCIVNKQGFHDTQDFVVGADFAERTRILSLGDSFAFGGSADVGKSYVETIERRLPDAVVWNTAIPGAGTNQALMSFEVYAPLLQPQVTILGFYMNDFDDNMMPVDSYFMGVDAVNFPLSIRQYQIDLRGNLVKLDRQSDLYYRYHRVDPPANELHRLLGSTRLGSIAIRVSDAVQQLISKAEGTRLRRRVEVTREYLIDLRDAATAQETQLLVLLIPRREDISAPGPLYENALRLVEEIGIAYLDPIDVLDGELDYAPPPDVHWSNAGHAKIGAILLGCLESFQATQDISQCRG